MTIPKRIIEKVIEGGWRDDLLRANPNADVEGLIEEGHFDRDAYKTLLNPLFWQALGKVKGWKTLTPKGMVIDEVKVAAHECYDLILTGGDTDAFWEEIDPTV